MNKNLHSSIQPKKTAKVFRSAISLYCFVQPKMQDHEIHECKLKDESNIGGEFFDIYLWVLQLEEFFFFFSLSFFFTFTQKVCCGNLFSNVFVQDLIVFNKVPNPCWTMSNNLRRLPLFLRHSRHKINSIKCDVSGQDIF